MKHLPRLLVAFAVTALVLIAEDFWVKKPYTEWSEKDAAKLLTNSPWSHEVTVGGGGGGMSDSGRGGRRGMGGGGNGGANASADGMGGMGGPSTGGSNRSPIDGGGQSAGSMGTEQPLGGRGQGGGAAAAMAGLSLHIRWQSATPLRQALVVAKLGHERADSDQAKKFLEQPMPFYVVSVVNLPAGMVGRLRDEQLASLAKTATLVRKDKDPITAENAQAIPNESGVAFFFPKTSAIALDDKEVEFVSKVGNLELKRKFKLKDMMVGDKLEL